jgi:hypothetical protein
VVSGIYDHDKDCEAGMAIYRRGTEGDDVGGVLQELLEGRGRELG